MNQEGNAEDKTIEKQLDQIAYDTGLAISVINKPGLNSVFAANENSICAILSTSDEFKPSCEKFCGRAYDANSDQSIINYKCFAGLQCSAVALTVTDDDSSKRLTAIVGRAFTKTDDYKAFTERTISGDWAKFSKSTIFDNLLIASSNERIENVAEKLRTREVDWAELETAPKNHQPVAQIEPQKKEALQEKGEGEENEEPRIAERAADYPAGEREIGEWRKLFADFYFKTFEQACDSIVNYISTGYKIDSVAWLQNDAGFLRRTIAVGAFETQRIDISLGTNDARLLGIFRNRSSVALRRKSGADGKTGAVRLFPIVFGGRIRNALVIGERGDDPSVKRSLIRFCQVAASELEVLRLRERVKRQASAEDAIRRINSHLGQIDSNQFWTGLMKTISELLAARRGSLLVYDPREKRLVVRAAFGNRADILSNLEGGIGGRIALDVWKNGKPLLLQSISDSGIQPAPDAWEYKSDSFICYPLASGKRSIGLLNLTDKTNGGVFDTQDLSILDSISPQLAIAIDRQVMKERAGEFEQLSVTDPLTGLLNRRYLEERLNEEIRRSDRHGYPMSFVMLDVDNFKSYNDSFTHPEGDKALQLVAQCVRESLREADVAARYGGEEFSILLPQTNLEEARIIAERIRERVENTRFPNRQVTVSIGITGASSARDTAPEIISAADKALFEAKRKGRNKVCIFEYERKNMSVKE